MGRESFLNQQVFGGVLLERLARSVHAGALKKETQVFKAAQGDYVKAGAKVEAAQGRRNEALATIGAADDTLDAVLLGLADRLVGAGLGTRLKPFAGYSDYTPSRLGALAYAEEVKAVQKLIAALRRKKLPADVAAAVKASQSAADGLSAALKALGGPQADYDAARQARDGLLLDWTKALGRVKRAAAVAYDEDKAGYRALFAPTSDLQIKRRAPAKKKPPASPLPPTP